LVESLGLMLTGLPLVDTGEYVAKSGTDWGRGVPNPAKESKDTK